MSSSRTISSLLLLKNGVENHLGLENFVIVESLTNIAYGNNFLLGDKTNIGAKNKLLCASGVIMKVFKKRFCSVVAMGRRLIFLLRFTRRNVY